jgi:diphosphomevalonate decarboxylase
MSAVVKTTAVAQPNIALVKYWGKRDVAKNLPATGSISMTLSGLTTTTTVELDGKASRDELILNGAADETARAKVARFLELLRQRKRGPSPFARVISTNDFPTAAGLASSASGFAALAVAAARAYELSLTANELSALARQGSGSAARSICGGFAEMHPGERADGSDAAARTILAADAWPLAMLVAVTSTAKKQVGSTEAMERTRSTSPFYAAWVSSTEADLAEMRAAILARDLERVGVLAEHSALKLHGLAMSAQPAVVYLGPASLLVMRTVWELRQKGTPAYVTMDAGPQVKVICAAADAGGLSHVLAALPGVEQVLSVGPGPGARLIEVAP